MIRRIPLAKKMLRTAIVLSSVFTLIACGSSSSDNAGDALAQSDNDDTDVSELDTAVSVLLDAEQEIPTPVGVPMNAMGTATVSVDESGAVTASLVVSNLSGPATMAHIHRGFAGTTGPVVIGLETDDDGTTWTVPADAVMLSEDEIDAFNNGELYFNVHTAANMPGEIRGQIGESQTVLVSLNAEQEIPAPVGVPMDAMGAATVSVDESGAVTASLVVSNLSGPATMAHIHRGLAGETGPVVIGLETADGGTTWTVPVDAVTLSEDEIDAFDSGELYFNVHTAVNMPGEIRGQINTPVIASDRLVSNISELDGTETLLDTQTGLTWINDIRFCFAGVTTPEASNCEILGDMALSGATDWRLPTSNEMSEVTLAVDADEAVTFNFINPACAVMTASDGWVFTENSSSPGVISSIEPGNAGVRCVSEEVAQ